MPGREGSPRNTGFTDPALLPTKHWAGDSGPGHHFFKDRPVQNFPACNPLGATAGFFEGGRVGNRQPCPTNLVPPDRWRKRGPEHLPRPAPRLLHQAAGPSGLGAACGSLARAAICPLPVQPPPAGFSSSSPCLCTSLRGSGLTASLEQAMWDSLCGWGLPAAGSRGHVLEVNVGCDPSNSPQPLWASASHLKWEPQNPLDGDVTCLGAHRRAGSSHARFHKPSHLPKPTL